MLRRKRSMCEASVSKARIGRDKNSGLHAGCGEKPTWIGVEGDSAGLTKRICFCPGLSKNRDAALSTAACLF